MFVKQHKEYNNRKTSKEKGPMIPLLPCRVSNFSSRQINQMIT